MTQKENIIPGDIMTKLLSIVIVALGNLLIIIGESLIEYGNLHIRNLDDMPIDDNMVVD